jgi:hypothetical protein
MGSCVICCVSLLRPNVRPLALPGLPRAEVRLQYPPVEEAHPADFDGPVQGDRPVRVFLGELAASLLAELLEASGFQARGHVREGDQVRASHLFDFLRWGVGHESILSTSLL